MKSMKCVQLGGACDEILSASTFKEIAAKSREHCMEKIQAGDESHILAMQKMQELMKQPGALDTWMNEKENEFNEL